jgi:metallo-beta-lactamase family protein
MDQSYDLNAQVYVLDGFSGHADQDDLAWWYEQSGGHIGKAFIVHGEPAQMEELRPILQPFVTGDVVIPELLQTYDL